MLKKWLDTLIYSKLRLTSHFLLLTFLCSPFVSCSNIDVSKYKNKINVEKNDSRAHNNYPSNNKYNQMRIKIDQAYAPSVKENNYSRILYGNNDTAVILLHGFISSPFEVYFLGKAINKHGYTAFFPLIDGFGGDTDLANGSKYTSWRLSLKRSIDLLSPHYSQIIIIGFSLGGTIVTDFLLNNDYRETKIKGVVLLAPYYSPKMLGSKFLNKFFLLFNDSISLKTLYRISRNQDLLIPISNPEYYNSDMPLKAVSEIIKFGNEIQRTPSKKKILSPTLFVYNQDDRTVNNTASIKFNKKHFLNLKVIKFAKNKKVRHQLAMPAGNKEFDTLCRSVMDFIESLNE